MLQVFRPHKTLSTIGLVALISACVPYLADDHCSLNGADCGQDLCSWCDHDNRGCVPKVADDECYVPPYEVDASTTDMTSAGTTGLPATSATTSETTTTEDPTTDPSTTTDTAPATCGDGEVQSPETCDDQNTDNTDDCLNACQLATCGDGFVWQDHEACDDQNSDDTDGCLSTCQLASCGDGHIWEGQEECDDQNNIAGDGCHNCLLDRTVFVSSESFKGDLGGLEGADQICQNLAQAAQLTGTYMAWLSTQDEMPATRFQRSNGAYVLVDGTIVANGWLDLVDGNLENPIDKNELGFPGNWIVWTNTRTNGTLISEAYDCADWASTAFEDNGHWGATSEADINWTDAQTITNPDGCDIHAYLYCFQQTVELP